MNIAVIGANIRGFVISACFSEMGNKVYFIDLNCNINLDHLQFGEPKLTSLLKKNQNNGNLIFEKDIGNALKEANIVFITTEINLDSMPRNIANNLTQNSIIVLKSTVPLGTTSKFKNQIQNILKMKNSNINIDVALNPDFLIKGSAVQSFMRPNQIIIGSSNDITSKILMDLYSHFVQNHPRFVIMSTVDAELTAYAYNAMVAVENSLMNELMTLCEIFDVNIGNVRKGIGLDSRITYNSMYDGIPYEEQYSNSKLSDFITNANQKGYSPLLLSNTISFSHVQKTILLDKIIKKLGDDLSNYKFCVWGLFSKNVNADLNEIISKSIIEDIIKYGGKINLYCFKQFDIKIEHIDSIDFFDNKYDAIGNCDALIILDDLDEFKSPDFDFIGDNLNQKLIFDGKNIFDKKIENYGFELYQIGG